MRNNIIIIISVKDANEKLDVTLESLANQSVNNFEIRIQNGGGIESVINSIENSKLNKCTIHVNHEKDTGLSQAWNKAISRIIDGWILLLNGGDILHHKFIENSLKNIATITIDTVITSEVVIFERGRVVKKIIPKPPSLEFIRRGSVGFSHPGTIVHSQIYSKIGVFNEDFKIGFDSDWIMRAWLKGCTITQQVATVYMEKGGMSDKYFNVGIKEFFISANQLNIVGKNYALLMPQILIFARPIKNKLASKVIYIGRMLKHSVILFLNKILSFIPTASMRRLYLIALGFKIGHNVSIGYNFRFYSLGNCQIDDNVVINQDCLFDNRGKIVIKNNVTISRGVKIFTAGHDIHSPFLDMTTQNVCIQNNAHIFSYSLIMPGLLIGNNAIVYPGSVVVKNVDSMTIVGGNPARKIDTVKANKMLKNFYPFPSAM
jgi:acetyltransferase-like isoleucine patch superfamily enzyme